MSGDPAGIVLIIVGLAVGLPWLRLRILQRLLYGRDDER